MKKLLVLSVIFALVAGSVFAADVSGAVIGTFTLLEGNTGKWMTEDGENPLLDGDNKPVESPTSRPITTSSGMDRVRIEASGENEDGTFGGWARIEGLHWNGDYFSGYAWWKPFDALLVRLGTNGGDGFWGKDGVTRWMFYQTVTDTGVSFGGDNSWGNSIYGIGADFNGAFFGGLGANALMLEIKPIDILGINIGIPFGGGKVADEYKNINIQLDLNLDFGNIALTFVGNQGKLDVEFDDETYDVDVKASGAKIYAYFGMPLNEQMSIDVGLGYTLAVKGEKDTELDGMTYNAPIAVGAGFKFASDSFGLKARVTALLAGKLAPKEGDAIADPMKVLFDVIPFFPIGDKATLFVSAGIGFKAEDNKIDPADGKVKAVTDSSVFGWHLNPFIQIGEEWGPKFLAGIKLWSGAAKDESGFKDDKPGSTFVNWAIPIAVNVSF